MRNNQHIVTVIIATLSRQSTLHSSYAASAQFFRSCTEAALFQNTPNPFTETTQIQYQLPQTFTSAAIYLYDMSGTQLDAFPLSAAGYGTVTINGGQLRAGLYLYALVVDGALVETKQMVLTR